MTSIDRFDIAVTDAQIEDLHRRLDFTRWPERETVNDWSQGAPLGKVRQLCDYWRNSYDWRRLEAKLNALGNFRTIIDGLPIHFLHVRSSNPNALPLLMTHGWPGSVVEFLKVVAPLTEPLGHGGKLTDAFHLIIPSLPGYGFSGRPSSTGWNIRRTALAWIELVNRLGYDRYVAQGGDWGAVITTELGAIAPAGLLAIHLNMPLGFPSQDDLGRLTADEHAKMAERERHQREESGYQIQQMSRPQTLGYGLADSPAGQAAWIYEKFYAWTDCGAEPETALSLDEMLDNISIYWFNNIGASSARFYWESVASALTPSTVVLPTGISIFPKEIFPPSRRWVEKVYSDIAYWNELDVGGHFAAFEQPGIFVEELRRCFRTWQQG